jgi:hypothetical protein
METALEKNKYRKNQGFYKTKAKTAGHFYVSLKDGTTDPVFQPNKVFSTHLKITQDFYSCGKKLFWMFV